MHRFSFVVPILAIALMIAPGHRGVTQGQPERLEDTLAGKPPWRRLFLDATVVEESHGLTRAFHAAEKYQGNPVVPKDQPWEGWGPYVYGTVLRDGGKLRMWYSCIVPRTLRVCYAESEDGLKWVKPNLGNADYEGSTANNIIGTFWQPSVIQVNNPPSADKRWAMYFYDPEKGAQVAFSADGLHWRRDDATPQLFGTSDVMNVFFDPYHQRYVATCKTSNRRHRAVGVALSEDGLKWRNPVEGTVFGADDLDPDATQVYGMPVFPYQGLYIGLPWIYHARAYKYGTYTAQRMLEAQVGSPCTIDTQLAWSWDLISWTRTPERKPFIPLGPPGSFDDGMVYTSRAPVIVRDQLYFYYGGSDVVHDGPNECDQIGLATLRLDGFCSMHAEAAEGWLISRRELFRTPEVIINAKTVANGQVTAELLDRENQVVKGFSRDECVSFTGDAINHTLRWKTKAFPAKMVGKDKKIRFFLKHADLYSYLPVDLDPKQGPDTRR